MVGDLRRVYEQEESFRTRLLCYCNSRVIWEQRDKWPTGADVPSGCASNCLVAEFIWADITTYPRASQMAEHWHFSGINSLKKQAPPLLLLQGCLPWGHPVAGFVQLHAHPEGIPSQGGSPGGCFADLRHQRVEKTCPGVGPCSGS